ncbi:MerR family transcriptional regulator [Streptomyces canus]|uniref:MerR family transcriptional regulator n=1 Tax=Streptomyces canus TaxID=58343 RepID=UPI0036E9FC41
MKISDLSSVSGVSARSLRHYEDEGLIVPGRFNNGFRDYCQSTVDRVLVLRSLLEPGLPVRSIREVLPSLTDGSDAGTGRGVRGVPARGAELSRSARCSDRGSQRSAEGIRRLPARGPPY